MRSVLRLVPVALALCVLAPAMAAEKADKPFVLGTSQGVETLAGKLQRRLYAEAFRRLDMPLQLVVMPLQRLTVAAEQGQIDGEVARVASYGEARPELVRVDEPVYEIVWALYASNPAVKPARLADLAATPWRATYLRGVGVCENALKPLLPAPRLVDVTSDAQGFDMMRLGRSDLHCTGDMGALALQVTPEFRDVEIGRRVLDIGTYPLHPYLHRSRADLAPRLAAVLRQMRSEGLLERYRAESLRELQSR